MCPHLPRNSMREGREEVDFVYSMFLADVGGQIISFASENCSGWNVEFSRQCSSLGEKSVPLQKLDVFIMETKHLLLPHSFRPNQTVRGRICL